MKFGVLYDFYNPPGAEWFKPLLMDTVPDKPEDMPNWQRLFVTPEQAMTEFRQFYANGGPDELRLMAKRSGEELGEVSDVSS